MGINLNHMQNINLNLLKALDALLSEQNVSKAGELLGVTQSAMSINLKQLRAIYHDDLLVRGAQGQMQLTTFAKTLMQPVKLALRHVDQVFNTHTMFAPKTAKRIFHIGMSDYIALVLLPKLMRVLSHEAPNVKIVQHAVNYMDDLTLFDNKGLDMVMGNFPFAPGSLKMTKLFSDRSVIVADKNHPIMKCDKMTTKKIVSYPQVFVALEGQPDKNFIADMLQKMGHDVNISLITPHTLIALQTLPGTLLVTNTVERLAQPFLQSLDLAMREPPYKLPLYDAKLYWHARDQSDAGHQWLREVIKKL
jgi:DNA-binding transcriptional LysR family regulator